MTSGEPLSHLFWRAVVSWRKGSSVCVYVYVCPRLGAFRLSEGCVFCLTGKWPPGLTTIPETHLPPDQEGGVGEDF